MAVGLAVALIAAEAAVAMPPPPRPLDGGPAFTWRTQPTIIQLSIDADSSAASKGLAEIECVINKRGQPDDCVVLWEDPPENGVGKVAIKVARRFRASAEVDGIRSLGRKVRYTLGLGRTVMP